jgi:hypothetical protein
LLHATARHKQQQKTTQVQEAVDQEVRWHFEVVWSMPWQEDVPPSWRTQEHKLVHMLPAQMCLLRALIQINQAYCIRLRVKK